MKELRTVYLSVLIHNIKKNGLTWVIQKILSRCLNLSLWLLLSPLAIVLHTLGFRRLLVRVEHIGHLAAEFDSLEKSKQLGLLHPFRYFVLAPRQNVSNSHLLGYWRKYYYIITNPIACGFLSLLTRHIFMRRDVSHIVSTFFGTQDIYSINRLWGSRPALLKLTDEDQAWGAHSLQQLGIAPGQWYVCLHVREGGFWPQNELIQGHRNASPDKVNLAIQEITRRGGKVVRMGDSNMTRLPIMPGVIDYAHHELKSERLDTILCAQAKFFLGCTSGLAFVSMVFGVPIAQANMVPIEALAVGRQDLSISKRLWCESQQRYLTFEEIFASKISGYYFSHQYKNAGIRVDENTSEDLYDLVCEMLDRLDDKFIETEEDRRLHSQFMLLLKPGHYSYGAISRVCLAFLKNYTQVGITVE